MHNKLGYFCIFLIPVITFICNGSRQGRVLVESGVNGAWATLELSDGALGLCELAWLPALLCGASHTLC